MTQVYLAGGIAGLTYHQATAWRDVARARLTVAGLQVLDPMRDKKALDAGGYSIPLDCTGLVSVQYQPDFIMQRDYADVNRCDAALVHWSNDKPSVGTAMELAWLHMLQTPAVVWGDAPTHPLIRGTHPIVVDTLEESLETIIMLVGV